LEHAQPIAASSCWSLLCLYLTNVVIVFVIIVLHNLVTLNLLFHRQTQSTKQQAAGQQATSAIANIQQTQGMMLQAKKPRCHH
jgi:hypothetical protein